MKKLLLILITFAILLTVGCKKKETTNPEPEPEPTGDVIVAENTIVVDEHTRQIITAIDTSNFNFTFNGSSEIIDSLQVGDILVDSASAKAPYGYLRKVTSVDNTKDGEVLVTTEQATLTEAIKKGKINFNTGKLTMDHLDRYEISEGVTISNLKNTNFTVFSMDYEKEFENENGKITVNGHTDLDIEFFFDFDWGFDILDIPPLTVELFESGVEINQRASIICVSEAGAGVKERFSLAKFYFTPWTFMVGPIPVVFVPQIELFVEMDGSITATFTASASENFNGRLGVRYKDGDWSKIAEKTYESDYVAPNLTAGVEFSTHVGPEVALLLYGVAGPKANVAGFGEIKGDLNTTTGNWKLHFVVGTRAQVGIKVDLIGFEEHWNPGNFILFSDTLFKLNNEPFGNNIYVASPSDGQSLLVGDFINVTTQYTGEEPDAVDFYYDYNLVHTDTEAPFEYSISTNGETEGSHVVSVSSKINGVEVSSDYAFVNLVIPIWDMLTLTDQGLGVDTDANDLFFINTTDGWMTVEGPNQGKILTTTDGGQSWDETYSSNTSLHKVIMFNNMGEGIFLAGDGRVMFTEDGGNNLVELTYGQFDRPSFQWMDVFDIDINNNGEILAVTKDEGIPYYFQIGRANMASHDPAGYFALPYPNEYGSPPKMVMHGNSGFLYNVYHEDEPNKSYLMATTDGGVSWDGFELGFVDVNTLLHGAHMPDETHAWIVGEEGGEAVVIMTSDGGINWEKKNLTGIPAFSSVYFTSEDEGYATIERWSNELEAKLYKTTDGGNTWSPMIDTRNQYGMSSVFFLGQDFGVVSGKGPYVFRYSVRN